MRAFADFLGEIFGFSLFWDKGLPSDFASDE
jgi:hypothetical protein